MLRTRLHVAALGLLVTVMLTGMVESRLALLQRPVEPAPDMVYSVGQTLKDQQGCLYTFLGPDTDTAQPDNLTCIGQRRYCCPARKTQNCTPKNPAVLCANSTGDLKVYTFCAKCPGEVRPPSGDGVDIASMRLLDTSAQAPTAKDGCTFFGRGPTDKCGGQDRIEPQCCQDVNANSCMPVRDGDTCPWDYPVGFCVVCSKDKFTAQETATLVVAIFGAVSGVTGTIVGCLSHRESKQAHAPVQGLRARVAKFFSCCAQEPGSTWPKYTVPNTAIPEAIRSKGILHQSPALKGLSTVAWLFWENGGDNGVSHVHVEEYDNLATCEAAATRKKYYDVKDGREQRSEASWVIYVVAVEQGTKVIKEHRCGGPLSKSRKTCRHYGTMWLRDHYGY